MSEAVKWAKAIAATEPPAEEEAIRSKWQFLVIDKIATDWPWDDQKIRLEEAYAEFEYPPDMKGFIGFIPASAETQKTWTDGTDPETLLQERVREYLESARKKFLKP